MKKLLFFVCLIFAKLTIHAQVMVEHSLGFYNFHASILKNNTNSNNEIARLISLGLTIPITKNLHFNTNVSAGNLANLGSPFKPYDNSHFTKVELEIRFKIFSKTTSKTTTTLQPLVGYGFTFIDKNSMYYTKNTTVSVQPGAILSCIFLHSGTSLSLQTCWNQRLDTDYRTFLSNKIVLGIPLVKVILNKLNQ